MTAQQKKMPEKEFRIYLIKIICEAKDEIIEQMWIMNNHSNKQLKEQRQEVKDRFNKEKFSKQTKQKFLK